MKNKVYAIQVADAISIKSCKIDFKGILLFSDTDELFYQKDAEQYIYIFKYGVICFYNVEEKEIQQSIHEILQFSKNPHQDKLSDQIEVFIGKGDSEITPGYVNLTVFSVDKLRLIMLNVSQSIALDNYAYISELILEETNTHTVYLEEKGKLDISGKKLKKYIGKVLNIKNKISENLYIFDSHDVTWDDEVLNKFDQDLKKAFDLKDRYRSIQDQVEVIKENLELFKDIMFHKESSKLEWIIIILILVEVVDMFILKLV
ncbi:RMD1 family protein [Aquimarina muelleri]|uniref:DUF155 domain-containing protein n=1 Tax=Aquimarina muelleri TaxID=279356 RepID=A0A918N4Q1_9FLAO|nr:RMD1 family protein [Aquimarina muelleri]MCX2764103.1 RMD1 family protein [Aquimarina muelleri]GGX22700.1 hypothetical protein GCM10007384_24890 [Aquimarina muelleri]